MSRLVAWTGGRIANAATAGTRRLSLQQPSLFCIATVTAPTAAGQPLQQQQQRRSLATGTRGSRGHGWYVNYRAGKGGRHLQGDYQDRSSLEECETWNTAVLALGSRKVYMDVVVEPARSNAPSKGIVPSLESLQGERHRLTLQIASTVMPETSQNFIDLCNAPATADGYKGSKFYRIERSVGLSGGDVLTNIGKTGKAAAGNPLKQLIRDPLPMWHVPGTVSMVVHDVDEIDSRFTVCTHAAHHLDGIYRAFGTLTAESLAVVQEWESTLLTQKGVPSSFDLIIVDCGVLEEETAAQAA